MSTETVAQSAPTRELRALALFRERRSEIEEIGTDLYRVPSCSVSGRTYVVDYQDETCECGDHEHRPGLSCKHVLAVGILYAKTHRRVSVAGDPFVAAGRDRPCACIDGRVYLGVEEEGAERTEAIRCKRCKE